MSTPLCDNPAHIQHLCVTLGLGQATGNMSRVFGGFHHRMWRLDTADHSYAIKQLSPDTDLADPAVVAHYNASEAVAEQFSSKGIGAVFALRAQQDYLHLIDAVGYLVYPWTDASALDDNAISQSHALKVASLLAKMHRADVQVPGLEEVPSSAVSLERIEELVGLLVERRLEYADVLAQQLPTFRRIATLHSDALPELHRHQVTSHGDLDQKNILWDKQGKPLLIDWESARKLCPTYEALLEALDWSGITSQFDEILFSRFLGAYQQSGGIIEQSAIEATFHCILGDWLDWLIYNVGRIVMLTDADQKLTGVEQIGFTLPVILRLEHLLPRLLPILRESTSEPVIQG